MISITLNELSSVSLYDLDNGSLFLHIPATDSHADFAHCYDGTSDGRNDQLATDLLAYCDGENPDDWDGNEYEESIDELERCENSEFVSRLISSNGTLSGHGAAYCSLIRALAEQMSADYICH